MSNRENIQLTGEGVLGECSAERRGEIENMVLKYGNPISLSTMEKNMEGERD